MKYLIVGGTGSLGQKLVKKLISNDQYVSVYSRDEAKQWTFRNELRNSDLSENADLYYRSHIGDVRDKSRLQEVIRRFEPNVIIVASALKHVETCEYAPVESIKTNTIGVQNVIDIVNEEDTNVEKVLLVSTDKACSPINVYGMSKAISERLITSQCIAGKRSVNYLCVRYGNVLESRGSIIPLFKHQIKNSSELTVTDPNMTRFIMTLDQSVNLILNTLKHGNSGETWVPKLPSMKIIDLAEIFSQMFNKKIKIVGIRPGEKIHEDLLNDSEITRTRLTNVYGDYYVLNSSILATQSFKDLNNAYTSNNKESLLDKDQLHSLLVKYGVLNMQLEDFHGRKIEEILDASVVSLGENK